MTDRVAELLDEVLTLSEAERAKIAAVVLASLEERQLGPEEQAEIDAAWSAEITRRLAQFKADGRAIPWEQVRARMRAARNER